MMYATMKARPEPEDSVVPPMDLRERLHEEIGRLERALEAGAPVEAGAAGWGRVLPVGPIEIRRELRFLRQVASALEDADPGRVWFDRAGLGSVLFVQDTQSGYERVYRLVAEPLHPLDASQVALESPIGQAFRGRRRGSVVWVDGAHRRRHLRIATLKALPRRLGMEPSLHPSASGTRL
jgi:hypothetical protein